VEPPQVDPDATPTISVTVSCAWLPYIRGSLQQLLLQTTWKVDNPADLLLAQQRAFNLIDLFQECSEGLEPFACGGDLRDNSAPFGAWSIGPCTGLGAYVPLAGYQSQIADCGGVHYNGVNVHIAFSKPVTISDLIVTYDMNKGSFDGNYNILGAQDLDHGSAEIGHHVNSDDLVDGTGLIWSSGPYATATQNIRFYVCAAARAGADPGTPGLCYMLVASISGEVVGTYDCS